MTGTSEKAPLTPGAIARRWLRKLQGDKTGKGGNPGNRAALARLRRSDYISAMAQAETIDLFSALGYGEGDANKLPRVATLASLLSHVKEDDTAPFARSIGRKSIGDDKDVVLKQLRFQRLVEASGEDEILRGFRRTVALLGGRVNVSDLSRVILTFDDERTRRDLAFGYYGAGLSRTEDAA